MSTRDLPYPLPVARGIGSRITAVMPRSWQSLLRQASDRWIGERHQVEIARSTLTLCLGPAAPARIRIALLADFHYDPLCEASYFQECADAVSRQDCDLVFFLGDFASHDASRIRELTSILAEIQPAQARFAILGNHDHLTGPEVVEEALRDDGIQLLRNRFHRIAIAGGSLAIAAFDSPTYRCPRFELLDQCVPGERAIVLCHEPDVFVHTAQHPNAALQLSGHTHGGQVMLPLIGSPLLPRLGRRYVRGHYQRGNCQLYVNRGLGTGHLHVRWGARPEITVLTLLNESK